MPLVPETNREDAPPIVTLDFKSMGEALRDICNEFDEVFPGGKLVPDDEDSA